MKKYPNKKLKKLTVQPISTNNSLHWSIQFDKQKKLETSKIYKFDSRGAPGEFSWKNTPNDNFLTVQPIFTSSIPIDSARLAKQN